MTQVKQWAIPTTTVTRVKKSDGSKSASGHNQRLYVGETSAYHFISYLLPTIDWSGVGQIVQATLVMFDDDYAGQFSAPGATDTPKIIVQLLTSAATYGDNPDEFFDSSDYTAPTATTAYQHAAAMKKDIEDVNRIDITKLVNRWAPAAVKQSDGSSGAGMAAKGLRLMYYAGEAQAWSGYSGHATDPTLRPYIELVYEYGLTTPDAPSSLTPSGAVASIGSFQGDFTDAKSTDTLAYSEVEVYTAAASNTGQTVTGGTRLYAIKQKESDTAILNARFDHVPADLHLVAGTNYKWRARVYDQSGQVSLWTDLVTFNTTNTDPDDPVLKPASGKTVATLDGIQFTGGTFSDPDNDALLAYQVQLSIYPSGDPGWDDDHNILWNTGKKYVSAGDTSWSIPYGGASLDADTYYWRARQWDVKQGVSNWVYASIVLTADFEVDPNDSINVIQMRPKAPWRIVIKDMYQSDGVTKTVGRGPGRTVAVIEDAYNVGASLMWNSPGEAHWTLGVNHPQMAVIEPKQTHYAIEFRQGDGWREVFAGLVDDIDANNQDIIFYGIDYLALLDADVDEHYDPSNPELPAEKGGGKYVTTGKNSIDYIITDQLGRAKAVANSKVGFITVGSIASMTETMVVYSSYQPSYLSFISGLINSHRAGAGKRTRLWCHKKADGSYEWVVTDDPGVARDNLRLRYGELVQGYRVVPFGKGWASRVAGIGRDKDGVLVRYNTQVAPGIDETVWGRWVQPQFFDGVSDANDLDRKVRQAAIAASVLGRQLGLGLRSGVLQPRDGYDLCDRFPVDIEHGAISTSAFGSGYWDAVGITWTAPQQGSFNTILTLLPFEDGTAPSSDLLQLQPISTQAQWQIGWQDPNPLGTVSSKYWLDQSTGKVYKRQDGVLIADPITGTA